MADPEAADHPVAPASSSAAARAIAEISRGHIAARCLHVAAAFGVADAIGEDATAPQEIAARTGLDADAVDRILRLLCGHGVFATAGGGSRHNAVSRLLRSDHPESLRNYVRMNGMPPFWDRFTDLAVAAQTGRPSADWRGMLAYFETHPEEARLFNAGMVTKARAVLPTVAAAYDFSPFRVIADIGGGRGHLLEAILAHAPAAKGVLFELPQVVADARGAESERLRLVAGNFFVDALPAADAYLLMDLLHDWADADAARILAAVRRAAPAHARVLIVETLVSEAPGPQWGKTLDIIMLAVTGGRERTRTQYEALLAGAGFRLERVLETRSEYSIVEAVVA